MISVSSYAQTLSIKAAAASLLALVLFAGCATRKSEPARERRYADLYDGLSAVAMFSKGDEYVPLQVVSKKDSTPLPGVTVLLTWNGGSMSLVTDELGVFRLPLANDLRQQNPSIRPDRPCAIRSVGTMKGTRLRDGAPRLVSTQDKRRLESGSLIVLYDEGQETLASDVMGVMRKQAAVIEDVTGLRPVEWGVVIIKDTVRGDALLVRSTEYGRRIWAYTEDECASGKWAIPNIHEWAEFTIVDRLLLSNADDGGGRFMTDGIAEYTVYQWDGRYRSGALLRPLLESGVTKVNLLEDFKFPVVADIAEIHDASADGLFPPGYPMSFVFWEEMCRQYGRDFVKRFLMEFSGCEPKDPKSAVRSLEKLSGRRDLKKRLTEADVPRAMEIVEGVSEAVPSR